MKTMAILLCTALMLIVFYNALWYLVDHVECTKDHAVMRCHVVDDEF